MTRRARASLAAIAVLGVLTCTGVTAAGWKIWGRDGWNNRAVGLDDGFTAAQAPDLAVKWVATTGGDVSATPTVQGNSVFVPDFAGNLFRIDKDTGHIVWARTIASYTGIPGDFSRTSPVVAGDRILVGDQLGAWVIAIDRRTGALDWKVQLDTHPAAIITQSGTVKGNRLYVGVSAREEYFALDPTYPCCTFRGSMTAIDLTNGSVVWKRYTIPDNLGQPGGFSGAAVWGSSPVVDTDRNALYFSTGNNYEVPAEYAACLLAHEGSPEEQQRLCIDVYDSPENLVDSIVAVDLDTGAVKWAKKLQGYDAFNLACSPFIPGVDPTNCPDTPGPDFDFGQAPMLYTAQTAEGPRQMLGAGQKSGIFWALDPDDGEVVWSRVVGPGGVIGGMQWGSATDGQRIFVAISNYEHAPYSLPGGGLALGGSFAALDAATGSILWQTPDPLSGLPIFTSSGPGPGLLAVDTAPVTLAGDVVLGGSLTGFMYALDASNGQVLWSFYSGGSVSGGAAVDEHVVYWGSGYGKTGIPNNRVYAFHVPDTLR